MYLLVDVLILKRCVSVSDLRSCQLQTETKLVTKIAEKALCETLIIEYINYVNAEVSKYGTSSATVSVCKT